MIDSPSAVLPVAPPAALRTRVEARAPAVLFVHQSCDLYGSDRILLETASALKRAGGLAIVLLPCGGPLLEALEARGIETHVLSEAAVLKLSRRVQSLRGLLGLLASARGSLRAIDSCLGSRRVDLVHSNTLAVLAGARWAHRHRVPHLWHVHEVIEHPRWAARAFPWLLRLLADRVVCNSAATLNWITRAQPRLHTRAQVVLNGAADPSALSDPVSLEALRSMFRPAGSHVAVGLIGRINRMKGHAVLIEAAQLLHERGIDGFSLVFIGSAPPGQEHHLARLREHIEASPLASRIVLKGFMADTAMAYAAMDIVCVPSTEVEAFGLVAVEAMAAGKPVLASAIGGLPEIVEHGRTGLLHRPGDAAALADALGRLLRNADERSQMGQAGRERFEREFSLDVMNRRMLQQLRVAATPGGTR